MMTTKIPSSQWRPTLFSQILCRQSKLIPAEIYDRAVWLSNLGLEPENVSKFARICSTHFKEDDFEIKPSGKRFLKRGAIPLIFRDRKVASAAAPFPLLSEEKPVTNNVEIVEVQRNAVKSDGTVVAPCPDLAKLNYYFIDFHNANLPPFSQNVESVEVQRNTVELDGTAVTCLPDSYKGDSSGTETAPFSPSDTLTASEFESHREEVNEGTENKENEEIHPCICNKMRLKKKFRYFGDITIDDLANPENRERCFNIIEKTIGKQKSKIRTLEQRNRRLASRIYSMKSLKKHVEQSNAIVEEPQIPLNPQIIHSSSEESEADINFWTYEELKGCAKQILDSMAKFQEKLDVIVRLIKEKFPGQVVPTMPPLKLKKRGRSERYHGIEDSFSAAYYSDSLEDLSGEESDVEDMSEDDSHFRSQHVREPDEAIERNLKSINEPCTRTKIRNTGKANISGNS